MNKDDKLKNRPGIDYYLDITPEVCPMTFVRTKLQIEKMAAGSTLEVRLKGTEPLENVPRSVIDSGNTVLSLEPEDPDGPPDGVHRLVIRKE
ncbi:MAG: sulfurtransferase TusA family protein [Rhodospirillaceae bacterium]|nr:sulfurtransferase TusA family protein [Rhodospirillaceae bacterium]